MKNNDSHPDFSSAGHVAASGELQPGPAAIPVTRTGGCGSAIFSRSLTRHPSHGDPAQKPAGSVEPVEITSDVTVRYVHTSENVADQLTKPLHTSPFLKLRDLAHMA